MPSITYVHPDSSETVVEVAVGESIMRGAVLNGVDGILAQCGGGASCGTCHVFVHEESAPKMPPMHGVEDELLFCTACPRAENSRLSCQLQVTEDFDGVIVHLPEAQV